MSASMDPGATAPATADPAPTGSRRYSRVGRPRPTGRGMELAIWFLMRLTGLGLFVLALTHFLILHVLYDPAEQDADVDRPGPLEQPRSGASFDWSLLMLVLFHAFMGVRTVIVDYAAGRTAPDPRPRPVPDRARPVRPGHQRRHHAARRPEGLMGSMQHEALIVGAGGAGLWAALELAQGRRRCRRR